MSIGSVTEQDRQFVETWENIATYQNGVIKLDIRGDEKQEVISRPGEFYITTWERMLTQSKIADTKDDPFKNGAFRPVVVPDNVTIETNPNALSDAEIFDIYAASDFAWNEWMQLLDSPATLNRMVDLADEAPGATVKRLREVQVRLREVSPQRRLTSRDETLQKFMDQESQAAGAANGGAPAAAERRGQGGRSAAYRH